MSLTALFLLLALILFVIAAIGVPSGRVNLVSAGLTFMTSAMLVGVGVIG